MASIRWSAGCWSNRIWLHHFGRPLVDTPGDFGVLGSRPQIPELLDLLALELVREGWSLKRLHKWIMTSTVYRQSSARRSGQRSDRPGQRLLLADAAATARCRSSARPDAGHRRHAGQGDVWAAGAGRRRIRRARWWSKSDVPRRSIYLQVLRTKPVSFLTDVRRAGDGDQLRSPRARAPWPRSR